MTLQDNAMLGEFSGVTLPRQNFVRRGLKHKRAIIGISPCGVKEKLVKQRYLVAWE
jgi:hypothetical protein